MFQDFSIMMRSHASLSDPHSQIEASLQFQQTLSIEAWPQSYLWVRIKAPTGLGYTVTGSIAWGGATSTFNDDVCNKTSDLFTHKKSNYHSAKDKIMEFIGKSENISKY